MIAKIGILDQVKTAVYVRRLNHSAAEVWAYLTENEKLKQWFAELEIQSLESGGVIHFQFGDGNYERIEILDVETNKRFAFKWPPKNTVQFELREIEGGCELMFREFLYEIDDHTAKDLTGWHVCLDMIEALLKGKSMGNRREHWEKLYPAYQEILNRVEL